MNQLMLPWLLLTCAQTWIHWTGVYWDLPRNPVPGLLLLKGSANLPKEVQVWLWRGSQLKVLQEVEPVCQKRLNSKSTPCMCCVQYNMQ